MTGWPSRCFGHPVYWYGVIIGCGFLLAVLAVLPVGARFGVNSDQIMDLLIFAVPLSVVGLRVYYVLFYLDLYREADGSLNWGAIFRITDGGLAIYGGIIAAALTLIVFCRIRKISFFSFADLGGPRPSDRPVHRPVGKLYECGGLRRRHRTSLADVFGEHRQLPAVPGTGGHGRLSGHPGRTLGCTLRFSYESLWNFVGHLSDLLDRKALEEI